MTKSQEALRLASETFRVFSVRLKDPTTSVTSTITSSSMDGRGSREAEGGEVKRDVYPADLAAHMKPGKPYRPSNGEEGGLFEHFWCNQCKHDEAFRNNTGPSCDIVFRAAWSAIGDDDYPKEWTHDEHGQPCCTAFDAVEPKEQP